MNEITELLAQRNAEIEQLRAMLDDMHRLLNEAKEIIDAKNAQIMDLKRNKGIEEMQAEIAKLKKEVSRLQCPHERGTIFNYRKYPATLEQPAEEEGTVECNACGERWGLGDEPEDIDLTIER